jgi:hypothetical protein
MNFSRPVHHLDQIVDGFDCDRRSPSTARRSTSSLAAMCF